jgi:hypothetical protein
LTQLLSQTTKIVLQQAQQTPQQNGEELQYSASYIKSITFYHFSNKKKKKKKKEESIITK